MPSNGAAGPSPGSAGPSRALSTARAARLGVVSLAALAFIWGYGWVITKVGLEYAQPFTFAAIRTPLSALSLFALLVVLRRPLRPRAFKLTLAVGLLQTTGFAGLAIWALESGAAGRVAVLTYTMPFWLLLMASMFLGERMRGLQWLAVALAFTGMVLVLAPWNLAGSLASFLAVASGFTWAASAVVAKVLHRRHQVDILSLTAWQMLLGSVPLIVIAALTWRTAPVWNAAFVVSLAYNVLLANALAWVLWLYTLRVLPAGEAGFGTLAIPVVGVLAAWLQLGERPSLVEGIGMGLVIGALAILTVRGSAADREMVPAGRRMPRAARRARREPAETTSRGT